MTDVWSERAEAYRQSEAHREGPDLDLLVEWAAGARTALDVASGGGHVTRRLRAAGLEVVASDPAPGMRPDVVCPAEDLPFADDSFDVVACRVAAHHFADVARAMSEVARVARDRVLLVDNLFVDEVAEEADRIRDPSHVRNYSESEWRSLFSEARLRVADVRRFDMTIAVGPWLERAGSRGAEAERVRALLADRIDGDDLVLPRVALKGLKGR
jgi:SAM-dependent methyltransferase